MPAPGYDPFNHSSLYATKPLILVGPRVSSKWKPPGNPRVVPDFICDTCRQRMWGNLNVAMENPSASWRCVECAGVDPRHYGL